jgi:hypothetical protein
MPKLAPQVERVARIRGRHVLLGGAIVAWATVALAHELRETGYPKRTIARETEAKFLDSLRCDRSRAARTRSIATIRGAIRIRSCVTRPRGCSK